MAIVNGSTMNPGQVSGSVVSALKLLRAAYNAVDDVYGWTSGISAADLEAIGFTAADATALLTAMNDAHAEHAFRVGTPVTTYPANYNYQASQDAFIGPL